jgi:enoyl-[acyl-carrier-protein] reductase (NADH)
VWGRRPFSVRGALSGPLDVDARGIFLEVVKRAVPLGRDQALDDIGHLAVFLASDAARNITSKWIAVDGGITLRQAQSAAVN